MEVARVTICLNKEWQIALDKGAANDNIHPWFLNITESSERNSTRLVQDLTIRGVCFGDEIRLPNGLPIKVVACGESTLTWNGDNLQIANGDVTEKRHAPFEKRVLVRLFTPWLQTRNDDLVLPWRILEEVSPGTFVEKQARSFFIRGTCFGFRHNFPAPTGPKMHIGCYGSVEWDGLQAHISS